MTRAARRARLTCLGGVLSAAMAGAAPIDAAADGGSGPNGPVTTAPVPDATEGLIPRRLVWPGVAVIVVLAVIATAALTGPIIRANTDADDDESAGSSQSE